VKTEKPKDIISSSRTCEIKPGFCCFGVVDECFLRCKMCNKWKPDLNTKGMEKAPVSSWKNAIASLRNITDDGFLINFGGGEPLLFDGLFELVHYASDMGFRTNIATNAFLIDEDMAKSIADSGLSSINLSLDSMDGAKHDYTRGMQGTHARVMKAIEYLDKYCPGLKKGICCVISDMNIDDILALVRFAERDSRLEWIYFMAVMQPNNTAQVSNWYKDEFSYLWPKDTGKFSSVIDSLIELKSKGYKIVNRISQLKAFRSYFLNPQKFVKISQCNLSRALHISSVGDIFVCFQWGRLGNIKSDRLDDLWNSDKTEIIRKNISACKKNCHFLINCFFEDDLPFSFS
jgi:MoaA/NifB/PqqE/SkfB family radical SAM enzyme